MRRYGLDEYGRYVEVKDGERLAIEPWPFCRVRHAPSDLLQKLLARIGIIRWWLAVWWQAAQKDN